MKASLLVLGILNPTFEVKFQPVMAARVKTQVKSLKIGQRLMEILQKNTPFNRNTRGPTKTAKYPTQSTPKSTTADQLRTIPTRAISPMNPNTSDSKSTIVTRPNHKQCQAKAIP